MNREQGEIPKEEISMRREKVKVIQEEDCTVGDIIGESQQGLEVFKRYEVSIEAWR